MSNKELDSLFKNKLEKLERQPSADVWSKIEAQTQQKKPVWLWMKIAAAILLVLVSGIVLWNTTQNEISTGKMPVIAESEQNSTNTDEIDNSNTTDEISNTEKIAEPNTQPIVESEDIKPIEPIQNAESNDAPLVANNNTMASNEQVIEQLPEVNEINEKTSPEALIAENNTNDATIENRTASEQQAAEGTTLVFNIEDFKKTEVATNTSTSDKPEETTSTSKKGFNKVLDLVKELKGDAGIGDLREAKNEVFALNFKKEGNDNSK